MTRDEWDGIVLFLTNAWKGEWTPDKSAVYFTMLQEHDAEEVMKALRLLAENSTCPYLPSVSEILGGINELSEEFIPPWNVVWQGIQKACAMKRDQQALYFLENTIHPLVRRFVEVEGIEMLRFTPFFGDYGAIEIQRLKERWQEFLQRSRHQVLLNRVTHRRGPRQLKDAAKLFVLEERTQDVDRKNRIMKEIGTA